MPRVRRGQLPAQHMAKLRHKLDHIRGRKHQAGVQVELRTFAPRQRIYKIGDPGGRAYVVVSGMVRVTTVDEDGQEVVVDEPASGEFFGFASMLEETTHQSGAIALEESVCLEVDRHDISILLQRKPLAGMDMLAVLGRQFHASQKLVRVRAARNPNVVIDEEEFNRRVAEHEANRRRSKHIRELFDETGG